ncbi:MAG: M1 family aminopeptidase [Bacteroidota bacterium]
MFKTFFFTELRYTLKQPMVYIFMLLMGLMIFFATVSDNVQIGDAVGNVYRNSPYTLTIYTSVMTIFGLIMATAFFNNAALRDHNNQFNEILFTTPLSKAGYFFGRFFGALMLSTVPILGVFLGMLIGSWMAPVFGWVDGERYGPFFLATFVNNYLLFILPNMFFAGTIIYAMATKWKSTVISFVGALVIIIAYIIAGTLISDVDNESIGALADIFGINTYEIATKYYTSVEKNTLNPGFSGLLLWNRLLWTGLGAIILLASYFGFSFKEKNKKVKKLQADASQNDTSFPLPSLHPNFSKRTEWLQFKSFFYTNFLSIVKSVTFKILFLFCVVITFTDLMQGFEYFGLKSYPLTYKLIDSFKDNTDLFVVIILVFFSGELIWRDRDNKINEVVDATPHTSFVSMAAKALSLVSITVILHLFFILSSAVYQLLNGYTRIELDVYLLDFFYDNFFYYIIYSGVMIFIQVVVNNKYIGYFVSILLLFIWRIIMEVLDISTNMLAIAAGPSTSYSDMNGFGPGITGAMWFNLYWLLFSILCLFIAGALWSRGSKSSLWARIKTAKKQVPTSYRLLTAAFGVAWIIVAGYVYYNTQVLNPYLSGDTEEVLAANYEKKYKKYEQLPLPKVMSTKYFIDIFPSKRDVFVKAEVILANENSVAIDSVLFGLDPDWETTLTIPNGTLLRHDDALYHSVYALDPPLQPGDSMTIKVENNYITRGFQNGRGNTNVVKNGTFLNNIEVMPTLGYNEDLELGDKNIRKQYDLPEKDRMPELTRDSSAFHMKNYLSRGRSDYIDVETVISTSEDQTAIAPGSLIKTWNENGRNYYHYKTDTPSLDFYSFISGKYQLASRQWNGIDIEIYHDPKHPENVETMMDAVERSLAYYTQNFGPYYHKQCRIVEFPRYASFAQAFPGTMPYSEAIGFVIDLEDAPKNNIVAAVIAHEMGHQWWAHQVVGAHMQGGTMTSESFAEYSALMTLKSVADTPMDMREFLKYDHDRYLRGRSDEVQKELPLYKVENQGYIHYGKGSVILYALQDYIGEDKVNMAMRNFLEEFKYRKPPYPSSYDFLKHLEPQVPDSLQPIIKDWFKDITLYDNRLKEATYEQLANGKYSISLDLEAYKLKADSLGNEQKVRVNDWVDVGFFMDASEAELYAEQRIKIDQDQMTLTFELDSLPVKAAIDPRHILIDRVYSDNVKNLSEKE